MALEGDYAYVADGWEGLTIVDVSDPYNLSFVSNYEPPYRTFPETPCEVKYVTVGDGIIYATGTFGLSAIDVSDPLFPAQTSRFAYADTVPGFPPIDDGNRFGVSVIVANRLFVAVSGTPNLDKFSNGLYEFDISDPAQPETLGVYLRDVTVPEFIAVRDSVMLVASWWNLTAFTIESSGGLRQRGTLPDLIFHTGDPQDLTILGNTALIAGSSGVTQGGITNIDISNLDSLAIKEDFRLPVNFNCVQMVDSVGFAGYFHSDLMRMRLNPTGLLDSVGFISTFANVRGIAVSGNTLYATSRPEGLLTFDVSDREAPSLVDMMPLGDPLRPIVLGNILCVGNIEPLASVYDITVPTEPRLIDRIERPKTSAFARKGDLLFASQEDSMLVYALHSDHLEFVKSCPPFGNLGMQIRDSLVFAVGRIGRINADSTIVHMSFVGNALSDFGLIGDYYFGSRDYYGLHVFDVTDPTLPVFITFWDHFANHGPPGDAESVSILDSSALLFESDYSISVIDVSDPGSPHLVDRLPTPGYAIQGTLDSEYLYVADQYGIGIFRHSTQVDTDDTETPLPRQFTLRQNFPNPFYRTTKISFELEQAQDVRLTVLNILGQRVRDLRVGRRPAGTNFVEWDGRDDYGKEVASGVYFARLSVNNQSEVVKLVLIR